MLEPGTRVGPYEVLSPLGAGGMGEVYRARDTVLGRDVALKTLPDDVARHPQRLARLKREARILASLNHPGIATLFGVEERDGTPVLAMEVVEGETLSDRLHRGPLPLKEALRIGQQVAEAVAAAHEQGVLHRDLKPANIRLTWDSRAKVLDFGLARSLEDHEPSLDSTDETLSSPASRSGAVMGTAPYMSPEQARAQEVDERTDVWGFGCVLYEMLTGRRAFPGATFSEVSAAILERDPDYAALPESTPLVLVRLLRRRLRRDQDERMRHAAEAALELRELLQEVSSGAPVVTVGSGALAADRAAPGHTRPRSRWLVPAGLLLVATAGIGLLWPRVSRPPAEPVPQPRFEATLPRGVSLVGVGFPQNPLALSPDGQTLAFVGCGTAGCQSDSRVYLRERNQIDARPIAGTEGAENPFFSPDGRWIGFGAGGKLKKIALAGGAVVTLADAPQFRGGSWGEDGTIVFNRGKGGLYQVSGDGGEAREITKPDPARREHNHRWPQHIPGSRAVLYDVTSDAPYQHSVAVTDLETGETRVLAEKGGSPRWSTTGHVLYGHRGILHAAPFDARRLQLSGPTVPVLEGVAMFNSPGEVNTAGGNVYYALAPDGTLVYSAREARLPKRTLVWLDREGRRSPVTSRQENYLRAVLSPDATRLAVNVASDASMVVLVLDLRREAWTKVTLDGGGTGGAAVEAWMPDGMRLLVRTTATEARLLMVRADDPGRAELLHTGETQLLAPAPDGRSLLFSAQSAPAEWDIWRLALDGSGRVDPFRVGPERELGPSVSPDGRFVAYASDDSGRREVYVRPSVGPGPRHQVSTHGAGLPRWSRDGREIFFVLQRRMMSAPVRAAPSFESEPARRLFDLPEDVVSGIGNYDVTPDGQRFLMIEKDPFELRPLGLVIVPDWTAELNARLAAAGMRN